MPKREPFWLLDVETNNMIGAYDSEDEALRDVLDTVRRYGLSSEAVSSLGMTHRGSLVAEGEQLAQRALDRLPEKRPA